MAKYPSLDEIRRIFEEDFKAKWIGFNAEELAEKAGHVVTTNTVLIGALTQVPEFPLDAEHVREVIKISVPPKAVDVNMKAFDLGIQAAKDILGL
ncbi:MAG: indolepyruvate ferredoxin oxidoreductase, beta subunit [Thermococcaceae archaeon]|nr:indolepyruvate ferredoxin oxidoreductase, beta subunit [Thermococcaceae archaeon]